MTTSAHVLVIDDDADQLETLCRGLLYLGYRCLPARTEAEALAHLGGPLRAHIDLLLVELSAPGKPGARLVAQVRSACPALPVLVVAGLARSPAAIALAAHGLPILHKPFTPEELGRAMQAALCRRDDPKGDAT